jgi:MoxR-like ATPase
MTDAPRIPPAVPRTPEEAAAAAEQFRVRFAALVEAVGRGIVGQHELVTDCLIALHTHGHVLLEGVPGLGKTSLVRTLSKVFGLSFGRVQCTPDLMPADILGTHIVHEDDHGRRSFRFERGPVFRNLLLVDEINRATPKTQAALLEVMQERQVSAGSERHVLPAPFFVLATQNPVEMEGTYPLPEAQLDRFAFKLTVTFPNRADLMAIAERTSGFQEAEIAAIMHGDELEAAAAFAATVPVAEPVMRYAADLVLATHPDHPDAPAGVKRYASYGASPRALQTLVRAARVGALLAGRAAVSATDIRRIAKPTLRHRVIRNFEGEAEGITGDKLVDEVLAAVPAPGEK